MGADYITATLPLFDLTPQRKEAIADFLAQQPERDLIEWANDWGLNIDGLDEEPDESKAAQLVRDFLLSMIEEGLDRQHYRDVTYLQAPGMEYTLLMTGGLSWGDSPTESFDIFWPVEAFYTLWAMCKSYSEEDHKNEEAAARRKQRAQRKKPVTQGLNTYEVRVEEVIEEVRTFRVSATSFKDAAEEAAALWINAGAEPDDGPYISVTEREYVVQLGDEQQVFDLSEVEES